jgi:hypothetical protein
MSKRYTPPAITVRALRSLLERLEPDWLLEPNEIGGIEIHRPDGANVGFIDIVEERLDLTERPTDVC